MNENLKVKTTIYFSGDYPFGDGFTSLKTAMLSYHKTFIKAHSDGTVDCREADISSDKVSDIVQVKPGTVAIRSRFGKYLSGTSLLKYCEECLIPP